MLHKINEETYKYHEPMEFEGMDLSIKFTIKKRNDGFWYNAGMDVEGETPQEVVEAWFQARKELI
jgi:hypothetical protein